MIETLSQNRCHGGTQQVVRHQSATTGTAMTLAVFVPPQADEAPCPVLYYLSGLTCTHANVMDKGEYRRAAAEHGLIVACPDTSPRGDDVADDKDNWKLGQGAGFYVDATQAPWSAHYRMASYVMEEIPGLIAENFNADMSRQSIFGHSMGGHGALTLALKNPGRFRSCSAFAPICHPTNAEWSRPALEAYLGTDETALRAHDASLLIADGARFAPGFLVDQGGADGFMDGLQPWSLQQACLDAGIALTYREHPGHDHSYFFISTFMADHIAHHAAALKA